MIYGQDVTLTDVGFSGTFIGYEEPHPDPYVYDPYYFTDSGDMVEYSSWYGPAIWWKVACDQWTPPAYRWTGKEWVKDVHGCYQLGGRRYVIVDWIRIPMPVNLKPEPRA